MKRPIDHAVVVTDLDAEYQNRVLDFACHLVMKSGISSILENLQPISLGEDLDVRHRRKIAAQIASKGLKKILPVAAMLVAEFSGPWQEKRVYEKLQIYVLIGAIRFPDRKNTIRLACRRLRRIKSKNSHWIFDRIMRTDDDLPSVVSCLVELEEELLASTDGSAKINKPARVAELRVLLADYLADFDRRPTGPTGPRESAHAEEMIRTSLGDHLVVPGFENAKIIQGAEKAPYEGAVATCIENQRYLDSQTAPQRSYRSYKAKQYRDARHAINEIRKRAVGAPCDWNSLTDSEVHTTLAACFESLSNGESITDALVVLSILLGRTPTQLLCLPFLRSHRKTNPQEYWYATKTKLQFTMQLPIPELRHSDDARAFTHSPTNRLCLSIPVSLQPQIRKLAKLSLLYRSEDSKFAAEIDERLRVLNKMHLTRLTEHRLATYMHSHLLAEGVDDVIVKRLRGASLKTNVPQHYDACPQALTQSVYEDYVQSLLATVGRDDDWVTEAYPNTPLGSTMYAKRAAVRRYFQQWRNRISEVLKPSTDPILIHNEYALATYAVLSACTGYRPVRHMFETIKDFDPISRELYIADKASRFDSDARCIVLPEIACEQMAHYVSHLEALQRRAWGRNMPAVLAARRALSGDGALLFRVSQQQETLDEIQFFTPAMVEEWLGRRWPLPLNWSRHFLCTELRTRGTSFELINALLGHSDVGPAAFDRFSKLNYRGMIAIASQLNGVLAGLEISAIEGLGRW